MYLTARGCHISFSAKLLVACVTCCAILLHVHFNQFRATEKSCPLCHFENADSDIAVELKIINNAVGSGPSGRMPIICKSPSPLTILIAILRCDLGCWSRCVIDSSDRITISHHYATADTSDAPMLQPADTPMHPSAIADRQCPTSLSLPASSDCDMLTRSGPLIGQIQRLIWIQTFKPTILIFAWF